MLKRKKKEIKNKKYKYILVFRNGVKIKGECEFKNLNEVYEFFLQNSFTHLKEDTKGFYYNKEEILCFEVEEILGEQV